MSTTYQLS